MLVELEEDIIETYHCEQLSPIIAKGSYFMEREEGEEVEIKERINNLMVLSAP